MTPQELSDNLKEASLAQFGDTGSEMFPEGWFNHNVWTVAPTGQRTQRAPKYCATTFGAAALASFLNPIAIVLRNAINAGGIAEFKDTEPVPYLAFAPIPDEKSVKGLVNAGTLLDYFNHGYPVDKVMKDVQAEIAGSLK